jgi:hypothetical protein
MNNFVAGASLDFDVFRGSLYSSEPPAGVDNTEPEKMKRSSPETMPPRTQYPRVSSS